MKKLKLETIEVTSFETSAAAIEQVGTVQGRGAVANATRFACPTDPNFDCTFGCSQHTLCPDTCVPLTRTVDCFGV
jgi:hypothetical protein